MIRDKGLSPENYPKYKNAKERYMTLDGRACERIADSITRENIDTGNESKKNA